MPLLGQAPGPAERMAGVTPPSNIDLTITGTAGARRPLAIPITIAPLSPDLQTRAVDPFYSTLTDDLSGSRVFIVADPTLYPKGIRPPQTREEGDAWKATSAQYLLDTHLASRRHERDRRGARSWISGRSRPILGKKYAGELARRVASPTRSRTTSSGSSPESRARSSRRSRSSPTANASPEGRS